MEYDYIIDEPGLLSEGIEPSNWYHVECAASGGYIAAFAEEADAESFVAMKRERLDQ